MPPIKTVFLTESKEDTSVKKTDSTTLKRESFFDLVPCHDFNPITMRRSSSPILNTSSFSSGRSSGMGYNPSSGGSSPIGFTSR